MSTETPDHAGRPGAGAVTNGLADGWNRMVALLFTGPDAGFSAWLLWGFILLFAASGISFPGVSSSWQEDAPAARAWRDWSPVEGAALVLLVVFLALIALVAALVWTYLQSRFRFVLLEGIRVGHPRLRGVWGRTARVGLHYFVFRLVLGLAGLLLLGPVLLAWTPVAVAAWEGREPGGAMALALAATVLWAVPVAIAVALVGWWAHELVLPVTWATGGSFRTGVQRTWSMTRTNLGPSLLLAALRLAAEIAGAFVGCLVACLSCWIWGVPLALLVGIAVASAAFPPAFLATAPVLIALGLVVAWIIATVTAPIPLLYRSWAWAFVSRLDRGVPPWSRAEPADDSR
jgi:hypothetical protein